MVLLMDPLTRCTSAGPLSFKGDFAASHGALGAPLWVEGRRYFCLTYEEIRPESAWLARGHTAAQQRGQEPVCCSPRLRYRELGVCFSSDVNTHSRERRVTKES